MQGEELALAQPGRRRDDVERLEPIAVSHIRQDAHLLGREGGHLASRYPGRLHEPRDVPRHEAPALSLRKRGVQHGVQVRDRGRRDPRRDALAVEILELLRAELGEREMADDRHDVDAHVLLITLPCPRSDAGFVDSSHSPRYVPTVRRSSASGRPCWRVRSATVSFSWTSRRLLAVNHFRLRPIGVWTVIAARQIPRALIS
jgi:hypothetical protein